MLAAALMTGAKTSNLPLLLPWALAILPSLRLGLRWPLRTAVICLVAFAASVAPNTIFNQWYCGHWAGRRLETDAGKPSPLFLAGVNVVLIPWQNLSPPAFPFKEQWHEDLQQRLPPALVGQLDRRMETGLRCFDWYELQMEENAGLGFGVSALLAASVVAVMLRRKEKLMVPRPVAGLTWLRGVCWSPVVSLLALMTQSSLMAIARLLVPYYALLLPPLLACAGHERVVMRRWWRAAGFAVFVMVAGLLVISPPRPLFPVQTLLNRFQTQTDGSRLSARTREVYSVYRERNNAFAPAIAVLPPDSKILGLITFDDPETSLWRPFGSRRIEHVCPEDTSADLKRQGIEYVLVREEVLKKWFKCSLDDWLKQMNARVVQKIPLNLRASKDARDWYLVQLR